MIRKLRHFENFHIILWLLKDTCWVMHYKTAGVIMVIPTIGIAFFLAVKTYRIKALFLPNLAVCCWISANAWWMLGEFFEFDHRPPALTFFLSGIVIIVYYFMRYRDSDPDSYREI